MQNARESQVTRRHPTACQPTLVSMAWQTPLHPAVCSAVLCLEEREVTIYTVQAIPNPAQHQPRPGYSQPRPATPSRLFPTLSSNPVQAIPNPVQQPRPGYSQPSSAPTPSRLFPTLSSNPIQAIPNPVHDMKLRKGLHKPTSVILNSIRQATSISVVACGALSALWRLTAHLSGRRRKQQGRASSL